MQRNFHRKPIHIISWAPSLITLFNHCKQHIVTSHFLLLYDSSKPVFFKINWFIGGMGNILIQAYDSPQSLTALKLLEDTGEYISYIFLDGPRLHPLLFRSRSNHNFEEHYHSFVGEIVCGIWAIFCCRKYMWRKIF